MNKIFYKIRIVTLVIATLTLSLVGCGTGSDGGGMGANSALNNTISK